MLLNLSFHGLRYATSLAQIRAKMGQLIDRSKVHENGGVWEEE